MIDDDGSFAAEPSLADSAAADLGRTLGAAAEMFLAGFQDFGIRLNHDAALRAVGTLRKAIEAHADDMTVDLLEELTVIERYLVRKHEAWSEDRAAELRERTAAKPGPIA